MRGLGIVVAIGVGLPGVVHAEPSWVDELPIRRPPGLIRVGVGGDLLVMQVGDQTFVGDGLHGELGVRVTPGIYAIARAAWLGTGDGPEVMPPTGTLRTATVAARAYGCADVSVLPCWAEVGAALQTIRWDDGDTIRRPALVVGFGFDYGIGLSVEAIAAGSGEGVDAGVMVSARLGYGP
jgi:hypothetical protein